MSAVLVISGYGLLALLLGYGFGVATGGLVALLKGLISSVES
jgi:hypothetical protein